MTTRQKAILALVIANVIWGMASPIFKWSLQNITPFTLAFLRFFGAALIIFPFAANHINVKREDWSVLIGLSLTGITINIVFFFFGLKLSTSLNAPIIASAGPIFLYLGSILILREKPHTRVLIGMGVGLLGILTIIINPIIEHGLDTSFIGNIFFIIATLGAVAHTILGKEIINRYSPVAITFWSFLIGSLTFFPFFVYEMVTVHPLSTLDIRGIVGLVFGIVFSSTIAYFFHMWGLKKIQAQEVGVFSYIDPVAAAIIALPLLNEQITTLFLFGSLLIFGGIFIAEGRLPYHPFHKLKSL